MATVKELRAKAKSLAIKGYSSMNKKQLENAIFHHRVQEQKKAESLSQLTPRGFLAGPGVFISYEEYIAASTPLFVKKGKALYEKINNAHSLQEVKDIVMPLYGIDSIRHCIRLMGLDDSHINPNAGTIEPFKQLIIEAKAKDFQVQDHQNVDSSLQPQQPQEQAQEQLNPQNPATTEVQDTLDTLSPEDRENAIFIRELRAQAQALWNERYGNMDVRARQFDDTPDDETLEQVNDTLSEFDEDYYSPDYQENLAVLDDCFDMDCIIDIQQSAAKTVAFNPAKFHEGMTYCNPRTYRTKRRTLKLAAKLTITKRRAKSLSVKTNDSRYTLYLHVVNGVEVATLYNEPYDPEYWHLTPSHIISTLEEFSTVLERQQAKEQELHREILPIPCRLNYNLLVGRYPLKNKPQVRHSRIQAKPADCDTPFVLNPELSVSCDTVLGEVCYVPDYQENMAVLDDCTERGFSEAVPVPSLATEPQQKAPKALKNFRHLFTKYADDIRSLCEIRRNNKAILAQCSTFEQVRDSLLTLHTIDMLNQAEYMRIHVSCVKPGGIKKSHEDFADDIAHVIMERRERKAKAEARKAATPQPQQKKAISLEECDPFWFFHENKHTASDARKAITPMCERNRALLNKCSSKEEIISLLCTLSPVSIYNQAWYEGITLSLEKIPEINRNVLRYLSREKLYEEQKKAMQYFLSEQYAPYILERKQHHNPPETEISAVPTATTKPAGATLQTQARHLTLPANQQQSLPVQLTFDFGDTELEAVVTVKIRRKKSTAKGKRTRKTLDTSQQLTINFECDEDSLNISVDRQVVGGNTHQTIAA